MTQIKLSPKQKKFLLESTSKINIAHGSVRSGKTYSSLLRFIELVINCPDNKIIMIGNSFGAIKENAVKLLTDELFRGYCVWKPGKQTLIFGDKEIRVIGAHDEGSVRAIQGNTHSLSYVDEITTIPYSFVDMLTTRLSHPWSKLIATCNPNSPVHPVKTNLIDNVDTEYCYNLHFDVDDNPALDEKTIKDLKNQYSGLFYRRYILGEWVAAEGTIYADFSRKSHVLPRAPHYADNYFVGVDYGVHNAFAAVMVGHNNTHSPHLWVEKEYFWDSKKTYRQKLNSELADDLDRFVDGYNIRGIYLDPSAESFELECKRRHMRILQAKNDVYSGITFVANLIANHELMVVKDCPNLIGEIEQYVWDSKKAEKGNEAPVKKNDHACFAKDTLIDGIPIQKIKVGDFVDTRLGKKKVTEIHRRSAICYSYFIGSKWITCTKDHPFFTVNRGWIKADHLIQSDILLTRKISWNPLSSANQSSSYLRGRNTDDILRLQMDLKEPILNVGDNISIEIFGSFIRVPYQKDTIYITSTKTPLIMIYPISNAYVQNNMHSNIQKILEMAFQSNVGKQLKNGINLLKESNGINRMQGSVILATLPQGNRIVTSASDYIEPKNYLTQNFVRIIVNQNGEEILELIMNLETASIAADNFHAIYTAKENTATTVVPKVRIGKLRVYNLSVEDAQEYFAEDILVHNCDALRYVLFSVFGHKKNLKWGEINEDGRTLGGGSRF